MSILTIFIIAVLLLLAAIGVAASVREVMYVNALSRNPDADFATAAMHFALAGFAALLPFASPQSLPFPHFLVYIISFALSCYAADRALVNAINLVENRYREYRDWAHDCLYGAYGNPNLGYQFDPYYRPGPAPALPDDMNLPWNNFILQPNFEEFFEENYKKDDEVALKAIKLRKKQLEERREAEEQAKRHVEEQDEEQW